MEMNPYICGRKQSIKKAMKLLNLNIERNEVAKILSSKKPTDMGYHYLRIKLRRLDVKIRKIEAKASPYDLGMRVN